jgi:aquaporin Z
MRDDREGTLDQGWKSYWAEFLGTFTLCFVGQASICIVKIAGLGSDTLVAIAIAHGLALAVMISALGATSGAHFNPAVTFGFLVTGRQKLPSAVRYWVSQILGALVASVLLRITLPADVAQSGNLGALSISPKISLGAALVLEFIGTFLLVTSVWGTAVDGRAPKIGGFGIGFTVLALILAIGPLTGAALNPARAFGAAIVNGNLTNQWVWWVGPLLGGAASAAVYSNLVLGAADRAGGRDGKGSAADLKSVAG